MVLHVAKGSFSDDVAHISFPTEVDKVRNEVIAVEEFGSWAPAYVIGGDGAAKVPASYIERYHGFGGPEGFCGGADGGTRQMPG